MTLLAIYRAWARDERERLDGPPCGRKGSSDDGHELDILSRYDLGVLVEELFRTDGLTEDVIESKLSPVYAKLSQDCDIEGRVCRGEDRIEVGNRGLWVVFKPKI